ncbi:glycosyltransferase, partial [Desulfovulcanus sp.]
HGWTQNPDLKLRCYETLDRLSFPFMDAVVALSEGLYNSLIGIPGIKRKMHLILNGVDLSEIDDNDQVNEWIVSLKAEGYFIIGYIGRLIHGKGLDILLHAASKLESVAWQLVIIGEGEQKPELKNLAQSLKIKERVHFFGFRQDRLSFLKGFDLFVLPSRSEGTPRCLMEAMAARIPSIVSDIPGCRILIEHGKTGMLFPVDDAGLLAERIEEMAANKTLRISLSRAARAFVEQNFSAERMADSYLYLYHSMANDGQKVR